MIFKDTFDLLLPAILALIALFWPGLQSFYRRRTFTCLILRELEELTPHPKIPEKDREWWEHQPRRFVHQRIFDDVSANRDFILSLDPELVYWISQLWDSFERRDPDQWLWYLGRLNVKFARKKEISKNYQSWQVLIEANSKKDHHPSGK